MKVPGSSRDFSFALERDGTRLQLRALHRPGYSPIAADWSTGDIRRRLQGGKRQLLARACGLGQRPLPEILDATAGLGRDAFVLAALGARVTLAERHPATVALLRDCRERALADAGLAEAAGRTELLEADAAALLASGRRWDTVLLDPMYPDRGSALPSRELQLLRELAGDDLDADGLLSPALANARQRVAVKRPLGASFLAGREPSLQLTGTQARFDIYLTARA